MAARDPAEPPKAAPRSGPRAIARTLRDLSHLPGGLALARLGYDLKRPVFALPIYRYSLTGAAPTALAATPPDPWPGDAGRGAEIVQGVFDLAGQRLANPAPLWAPAGAGAATFRGGPAVYAENIRRLRAPEPTPIRGTGSGD